MSVDVVLKDRNGSERTYSVESAIALPTPGGGTKLFYANGATLDTIMNHAALSGSYADSEITSIPSFALAGYSQITSLAFPACVSIGEHALDGCSDLSELSVDWAGFSESGLGSYALAGTAISEFKPENGVRLAEGMFRNCPELSEVWLYCVEDGYIPIQSASYAFAGCSKLMTIKAYRSASEINPGGAVIKFTTDDSPGIFQECRMLSEVFIGAQLAGQIIPPRAFRNCNALRTLYRSQSRFIALSSASGRACIGADAFAYCSSLQTISFYMLDVDFGIGPRAFNGCVALSSLYLRFGVESSSYSYSYSFLAKLWPLPTDAFMNTPFSNSSYLGRYGSIFISPSKFLPWIKAAPGWSVYSSRMVGYNES